MRADDVAGKAERFASELKGLEAQFSGWFMQQKAKKPERNLDKIESYVYHWPGHRGYMITFWPGFIIGGEELPSAIKQAASQLYRKYWPATTTVLTTTAAA